MVKKKISKKPEPSLKEKPNAKPFKAHEYVSLITIKKGILEAIKTGNYNDLKACIYLYISKVGASEIAEKTGLKRPNVYRFVSGNPTTENLLKITKIIFDKAA